MNVLDYGRQREVKFNQQNEIRAQHLQDINYMVNTEHFSYGYFAFWSNE